MYLILVNPLYMRKQVLLQPVKTQIKCHIMGHFIRAYTVKVKIYSDKKYIIFFKNYNMMPPDMYNGLSHIFCMKPVGLSAKNNICLTSSGKHYDIGGPQRPIKTHFGKVKSQSHFCAKINIYQLSHISLASFFVTNFGRQPMQTQIRSYRVLNLIWVFTVCLQNVLLEFEHKWKIPPNNKNEKGVSNC